MRMAIALGATAMPSRGPAGRLATGEGVDPLLERGVGRQREIEALADAVGVEPDELARGVDDRPARRAGRERRRVLDRAGDPPAARAAERALDAGDEADGDARRAAGRGRGAEHRRADAGCPSPYRERRGAGRVDLDDREVAVPVDAGDPPGRGPAIGEANGGLAAAQVVGVRDDAAVGDDDARAALPLPDADDRGTDLLARPTRRPPGALRGRSWCEGSPWSQ